MSLGRLYENLCIFKESLEGVFEASCGVFVRLYENLGIFFVGESLIYPLPKTLSLGVAFRGDF